VFGEVHPDDRERFSQVVRETINSGVGHCLEFRVLIPDGDIRVVESQTDVLRDEQGNPSKMVVVSRDITDRKKATVGFRSMVEVTNDWLWETDVDGLYTYSSPKVKDLLGYEQSEIVGRKPSDLMIPEDAARIAAEMEEAMRLRRPFLNMENRNLQKGGHVVILETSGVPVIDHKGVFQGYRGIHRDITERKHSDEQLRKLSRAVEQSPASIIITNTNGDIEYVNPRTCELTGYSYEEIIGQNPRILKSGEMPAEGYRRLWETIREGGEWRGELHNRKKSGELYWEFASISPIRDAGGKVTHYLAVKEDVTDRKRVDEERIRLVSELQRALAKVKTLSGLLPICAWCKKVRDDEGYWKQIESYIEAHSDAEFTHGICPDCAERQKQLQARERPSN
jgi:PAS domain S-box-containing protein